VKIYTRTGDGGKTSLIGEKNVSKGSQRVVSYGTIDELNSFIGLAMAFMVGEQFLDIVRDLHDLQNLLFDCGSDLATAKEAMTTSRIKQQQLDWLERQIDCYAKELPELKNFILPSGSQAAAYLHVARTIARRAEREIVRLLEKEAVYPQVVMFINRLSDYLFTLARYVNLLDGKLEREYRG